MITALTHALNAGEWAEAGRLIKALDDGQSPQWPYNLGQVLIHLNELQAARDAFLDATARDPSYAPAQFEAARMALDLGKLDLAYAELLSYRSRHPSDLDAVTLLAPLALRFGDFESALDMAMMLSDPVLEYRARAELRQMTPALRDQFLALAQADLLSALGRVSAGSVPHRLPVRRPA